MSQGSWVRFASLVVAIAGSASGQVQFVDVAPATGTINPSYGRGAAFADFDGDGLLDLVCADSGMNMGVYRQKADHTFEPAYLLWGLAPDTRSHWGVLAADFDNDGDDDLYVLNGGFTSSQANQVLRNDIPTAGVFTDVSASSLNGDLAQATFGGTTLDFDHDGLLDIFLSNTSGQGCNLLRNEGAMTFRNVSVSAGISQYGGAYRHCSAGDVDNDGWLDVGVGNFGGDNLLYRNNRDGTFTDIAVSAKVASSKANFGFVFDDFDNDGWMDVYVPKYQLDPTGPSRLFLNLHDSTFRDVSVGSGITGQCDMGHNTCDVDGDGYPDVFIGTGSPATTMLDKLFLVTPDPVTGLHVTDVSSTCGIQNNGPTRCHGSAFSDYDQDGDVDLYTNDGGPETNPKTLEDNAFWQNVGNGNHWLEVDLEGVRSNRSAVGARACVTTSSGREIWRFLSAGKGFGNTDSATLHFGLGADDATEELLVTWPNGLTQRLWSPGIDHRIEMIESGLELVGDPTPGATVTLDLCGPADHEILVYVSNAPGWHPRRHSVLELEFPLEVILTGALDASGLASLALDIPDDPELAGASFCLQACIHMADGGTHGDLTNRIDATIH